MALGVRQRRHVFLGLDENLRSVTTDDGGKRVSIRLLPSHLKAKFVAVKCDGLIDVADDEERQNRLCRWSCHKRLPSVWADDSGDGAGSERGRPLHASVFRVFSRTQHIEIFQARAGVEEDYRVVAAEESAGQQF